MLLTFQKKTAALASLRIDLKGKYGSVWLSRENGRQHPFGRAGRSPDDLVVVPARGGNGPLHQVAGAVAAEAKIYSRSFAYPSRNAPHAPGRRVVTRKRQRCGRSEAAVRPAYG